MSICRRPGYCGRHVISWDDNARLGTVKSKCPRAFPRKTLEPSRNFRTWNLFTHLNQLLVNYGFNCTQNWERTIKQYLTNVISILVRFFIGFCGKMRWKRPAEWGRRFLAAVSVSLWLLSTALYYIGCRSYIAQTKTAENCRRILMKNVHKVNAETTKNTTAFSWYGLGTGPLHQLFGKCVSLPAGRLETSGRGLLGIWH